MKYLLIIIFLCSCSLQRRAANKIDWLKDRGFIKTDSIVVHDTIKGFSFDTIFKSDTAVLRDVDTFVIDKGGIAVKTVVRWKERVLTEQIIKKDTVINYVKSVTKVEVPERSHSHIKYWIIICLLGAVVLGLVFKGR